MGWSIDIEGLVSPLVAFSEALSEPNTIAYPQVKKEVPRGYRGFHLNDLYACIGCANCQDVCMNDAIDMVKVDKIYNQKNSSQCIPKIDYGRCCWCSLCTDVCPPESLVLGTDCVHSDYSAENFLFMPLFEEKESR
jgi:formate hydrogenlyase subunit 6/NADH:ubiquinone oxidoreductase subunit I